jgi:flavin reductase (DIM6/NTAB) family NADH-FMN oxidoreductase RutF
MHKFEHMECLDSALNFGAFLVSGGNVMVASWGFVGVMWGKKVYIAPVRDSRYTKEFMDSTGMFTISVPKLGTMKKELAFCGTKSGREFDKWAETGLRKVKAKAVDGFVVEGCERYFECKVLSSASMEGMDISAVEKWYPTLDMHNFYFGEIVEEY